MAKTRKTSARRESRASPENPKFSLNDPEAVDLFLGGEVGRAGVRVNPESALTYSPYWRGVNLISRDVAKLPLLVYEREGEGKTRATDHPAYQLLRYKPNAEHTAYHFRLTLTAHAINYGNGFAYIVRQTGGLPTELIPLLPDRTHPLRVNGTLWYVTTVGSQQRRLPAVDVLHVHGLGFDGLSGYALWEKARHSLSLGMAAEEFGSRYFANNAEPSVVIEHPARLTAAAADNLRKSWNAMHQGLTKAHRVAILEEGMKLNAFGNTAQNAQLTELRQYQVRDVANWLGVPPHKLGDTTRTAFASLEQENQSYLDDALDPWLVAWEEECRDKLLAESEKRNDTHSVEFLRHALVRADLVARSNYYRMALGGRPWMTMNEVRARESLNPLEGGDVILEPLNMAKGGGANNDAADSARAVFREAARRAMTMVLRQTSRQPSLSAVELRQTQGRGVRRVIASSLTLLRDHGLTHRSVDDVAGDLLDTLAETRSVDRAVQSLMESLAIGDPQP